MPRALFSFLLSTWKGSVQGQGDKAEARGFPHQAPSTVALATRAPLGMSGIPGTSLGKGAGPGSCREEELPWCWSLGYCLLEVVPLANSRVEVDVYTGWQPWAALLPADPAHLDPQGEAQASDDESLLLPRQCGAGYRCGHLLPQGGRARSQPSWPPLLPFPRCSMTMAAG